VGTDGGNGFIAEGSARGDCREFRTISAVQECCYIERKEGGWNTVTRRPFTAAAAVCAPSYPTNSGAF